MGLEKVCRRMKEYVRTELRPELERAAASPRDRKKLKKRNAARRRYNDDRSKNE